MIRATDLSSAPLEDTGAAPSYRLCLTLSEHSAVHLRRILRAHLYAWGMPHLADASCLALTELAANVVHHVRDRRCTVRILRRPAGVRVEVTDTSPCLPHLPCEENPLAEGGRGLHLVEAVTDRWGARRSGAGKTVWFECEA
ncbi:ATP-binding protein [Streptomyces sp. KLOTTS4A1]|uniref:ATP-binding protein n=1 Tax=Streptomyces sp. KLOTTS4A1 TaxID=3390996 RepID=UPI0039F53033